MKKIIVALDNLSKKEILELVEETKDKVMFKINDSFIKFGPTLVKDIHDRGGEIFLDLKFHDIPNTVANYVKAVSKLKVAMFNIHCSGGYEMMSKAKIALDYYCEEKGLPKPRIIGVTVLTSMNKEELGRLKIDVESVDEQVKNLALLAKQAGLDGVVCSANEVRLIKEACGEDFLTVTPGIRPLWSVADDQKRITTPRNAVEMGSDFLVIGRPITKSTKHGLTRIEAVDKILEEIMD